MAGQCPEPPAGSLQTAEKARRQALEETLRWGEATVAMCPPSQLIWCIPLMHNAAVLGGLVASVPESAIFPQGAGDAVVDVEQACVDLRMLAEQANLTNAALLKMQRSQSQRHRVLAEALHEFKGETLDNVREMYIRAEPELVAAIRKDDLSAAREILNKLLVAMIYRAAGNVNLIKSFFMELVVTMTRTAVESGARPEELLGANYASISQLSAIDSDEDLAQWLHQNLDHVMESIRRHRAHHRRLIAPLAMKYIQAHIDEDISRDDVARATFLSPAHFSRVLKKELGRDFTDLLNQMRIDRASELLIKTRSKIAEIALDCGFNDQTYFTKIFKKYAGMTPKEYRGKHGYEHPANVLDSKR